MASRSLCRLLVLAFLLSGCKSPLAPQLVTRKPTSSLTLSPGAWAIRSAHCIDCHGATPFPAGIDLRTRTSLQPFQIQDLYDGVRLERAPAGKMLAAADIDTLLRWAVQNGAQPYPVTIPTTLHWSQAAQMAGAANGSDGQAPGRFFGFAVEDLARSPVRIENYTDNQGVTRQCLALSDYHTVDPDSFSSSTHPVNYVFPDGVAWNGRCREIQFSGYVVQDRHMGIFIHSRELKKGPSPYDARRQRTYVRLQVDQDYFAWRGRRAGNLDNIETYPWNTAPPDPWLVDQAGYSRGVNGFYLSASRWYFVQGSAKLVGGHMIYHATLRQDGPTGALIAEIGADRADTADAFGGFGFFTYTQNSANHADRWAGWTIDASLYGGGTVRARTPRPCKGRCDVGP